MSKDSKGFAHLFLLVVVVVIGIGGLHYYSWQKGLIKTTPNQEVPLTPTTTIDETANWKTYKNTKYNYSLKYPDNFFTTNSPEDKIVVFYISSKEDNHKYERPQIYVQIHEKTTLTDIANTWAEGKKAVQEIYEESKITPAEDGPLDLDLQEKTVNGQSAYYFEKLTEDYMGITTYLEKNGNTYAVSLLSIYENNDYYKTVYYQILSTFEFFDREITKEEAEKIVRELSEVKNLLAKYPKYIIDAEGLNEEKGYWTVHVYVIVNDHTATFNWYYVGRYTGEVVKNLQ